MGVASNRQKESVASSWILQNKKTTRLINCLICRKPRGGRPGYDSDQGRKFLFPYPTNTVCGRGLLRLLTCKTDLNVTAVWGGACGGPRHCCIRCGSRRARGREVWGGCSPFSQWEMPLDRRRCAVQLKILSSPNVIIMGQCYANDLVYKVAE